MRAAGKQGLRGVGGQCAGTAYWSTFYRLLSGEGVVSDGLFGLVFVEVSLVDIDVLALGLCLLLLQQLDVDLHALTNAVVRNGPP